MFVVKVIKKQRYKQSGLEVNNEKLASQQCYNAEDLLARLDRSQFQIVSH